MEPMSIAMTFATIVSLMADFVAHRGADEGKDFDSFMAWLAEQRHGEVIALLESNATTTVSVKAILNDSREAILDRLGSLDKTLATITSGIDQYRGIAQVAYPSSDLSPQAISVLEQFYDSGATAVLEAKILAGTILLMVIDGLGNGQIEFTDPRFIQDDLETLVGLGFLALDFNRQGQRIFKFKRTAAAFVEQRRRA